ncbi:hypothetical protein [Lentilactobacillus parabuchneri]|jgi:hypothetical protein|uniref:hypothetical protein n=1 Tax=Lentilactobacillus parabuchneri TaxID=152331 RepID=UPI000A10AA2B|nr:hypothetical protein [Lentilactobacillus parabuchneri]ORM98123.1 hypothetical protein FAM21809_00101 [Lentilactobacillus parabuchneri]ORN17807.1 hypothetical protein FAM23164_00068 [Lentilactobacillus parabuchneri]ORN18668.1 hypothetical protein FAM23166_02039 [Lentilactobacillus parabuchneri]ORN19294.1 hypothetical protein FAM23165_00100 [Lentilactobacillus parabuchneri]ORN23850.1 hypothetical protein FAM23167_02207 [Lentilactobacillus parabuchneri]
MTVKIADEELFNEYQTVMAESISDWKRIAKFAKFIDKYADDETISNRDDLASVIDAILNHEMVKLSVPMYRLKMNGMVGNGGQQYVSRRVDDRGGYFICGIRNLHVYRGEITQQFTRDEAEFLKDLLNNSSIENVEE